VYWVRITTIAATQQKGEPRGEGPEHTHLWVHEGIEYSPILPHMFVPGSTSTTVATQVKEASPAEGPSTRFLEPVSHWTPHITSLHHHHHCGWLLLLNRGPALTFEATQQYATTPCTPLYSLQGPSTHACAVWEQSNFCYQNTHACVPGSRGQQQTHNIHPSHPPLPECTGTHNACG
jgi:hypothetical protein